MPSLVHANVSAPTYMRLIGDIPVEEADNGLVTVNLSFIAKASDRALIYPQFYVDAPPPIWPSGVDQNTLQTRQLFMSGHSYSFLNGMMSISATYVGVQSRFVRTRGGFVVTSKTKEGPFVAIVRGALTTIRGQYQDANGSTQERAYTYTPLATTSWNRFIYQFEYAYIDGQPAPAVTNVSFDDLVEINGLSSVAYEINPLWRNNPSREQFVREIFWNVSDKKYGLLGGAYNYAAVTNERDIEDVTPSVKIMRQRILNGIDSFNVQL